MSSFCEEEISHFVEKHLKLLEDERNEELEQSRKSIISFQGGVFVKNVMVYSYSSCVGGFVNVEFRSANCNVLKSHNIVTGDVVGVIEGQNIQNKPFTTGIVKFSKDDSIGLLIEDISSFKDVDDSVYILVKLANDATYSRLKSSLKTLVKRNGNCLVLIDLLFGKNDCLDQMPIPPELLDSEGELNYFNNFLHEDQKQAVKFALKMKNLAVIHGPPGTGKTTTLVEIIQQMVKAKNKILVCASSNVAVDNLVEKLSNCNMKIVRLGHPARVMERTAKYSLDAVIDSGSSMKIVKDVRKELNEVLRKLKCRQYRESQSELYKELKALRKELQQRESRALQEVLRGSDVVLSTLVTSSNEGPLKHLPESHFNCVVIDECSQALEAACWIALPRAPKAILAGDHLQLPPTVLSQKAQKGGLGISLMERITEKFGKKICRLLTCQFRMHTDIMNWPSQEMYGGQLQADQSVAGHLLKDLPFVNDTDETDMTLLHIDTSGCHLEEESFETSRCNRGEAGIISVLVKRLVAANVPEDAIAVITPYNYQVEMVKAHIPDLKGVEVRSVDGFQGREKEAILISMVRSNPLGELGFVCDRRRLNVAVSRARRFLCVVGDSSTLSHDNVISSLLDYIGNHGVVHTAEEYISQFETPKEVLQNKKFQSSSLVHNVLERERKTKKQNVSVQDKEKQSMKTVNQTQENQIEVKSCETEKEEYYESVLYEFLQDATQFELTFPASISSFDRRIIHQVATKLNLVHISTGEGKERCITVCKKNSSSKNKKPVCDSHVCASEKSVEIDSSSEELTNCETKIKNSAPKPVSKTSDKVDQKSDFKKSQKITKKSKKKENFEDFDSLIAEFQQRDKLCFWSGCKISTDSVGLLCVHCKQRFCINHGLPEIHGCGEAARKAAKHQFRHPLPSKTDPTKRNAMSKKLEKKLAKMADERKPQKKET